MTNVKINHNKIENKSEITTDEIGISDDKGTVFIQAFKLNRRTEAILATYSHISIQSCVDSMDLIGEVRERMLDIYQPYKRRTFVEDTNLAIGQVSHQLFYEMVTRWRFQFSSDLG